LLTYSHVGAAEVVVDGADHAHDVEVGVLLGLFGGNEILTEKYNKLVITVEAA
jgi:hypothetical protein